MIPSHLSGNRPGDNGDSEDFILDCRSEQQTVDLGRVFAQCLRPGHTVLLNGQLGSGKTGLVRATCIALGIAPERVNSPTFVLMQLYEDGAIPVAHFDTYRLADSDEFLAIGGDEYLECGRFVSFVEWAERIADVLPVDALSVMILQTGETSRQFHFHADGLRSRELLRQLRDTLSHQP
ncbi:MAG: tRNA (adenosine(37)-N6)-threonylcarbamoyltransferase complex ATPase subunit type 1 TsaE [Planctomycetaceae bacterium]|nr:tRNA (adenosine(37)-N6)-threonylcarbamoyltransferase complex ATPase subunit type 1 TsaE [Planctomycetaceae bacterium]